MPRDDVARALAFSWFSCLGLLLLSRRAFALGPTPFRGRLKDRRIAVEGNFEIASPHVLADIVAH